MTKNGKLPDYLLIYSETTGWYVTDRHGNMPFPHVKIRVATMLEMLTQAGATYQIIDPRQHITKGNQ